MKNLINNNKTDKDTLHSYIDVYQEIFKNKKTTAKNILEIGIGSGGSIKLWHDYFLDATIYGVDISSRAQYGSDWNDILNNTRISLYDNTDAYNETFIDDTFSNTTFDIIIDDGPHTLDSMITFMKLYPKLLSNDGIIVIEDIQSIDWIETLTKYTPDNMKQFIQVADNRNIKNRYDDIMFIINKGL